MFAYLVKSCPSSTTAFVRKQRTNTLANELAACNGATAFSQKYMF